MTKALPETGEQYSLPLLASHGYDTMKKFNSQEYFKDTQKEKDPKIKLTKITNWPFRSLVYQINPF